MKILVNIDKNNNENVPTGTTPLNQKLLKLEINKSKKLFNMINVFICSL